MNRFFDRGHKIKKYTVLNQFTKTFVMKLIVRQDNSDGKMNRQRETRENKTFLSK